MYREILVPTQEQLIVNIPKNYVNHRIEILILPFDEIENTNKFQNNLVATQLAEFDLLWKETQKNQGINYEGIDIDAIMNETNYFS